jgi:predicted DNA-binding protein (UPF0251 family)
MGRNPISRQVLYTPQVKGFRPFGRFHGNRREIILSLDEFEAIRLLDYENLTQEEAAVKMQVSRPTLTRIYEKARKKYATALVEGCSMLIEGGDVKFQQHLYWCSQCHEYFQLQNPDATNCPQCNSPELTKVDDCYRRQCRQCRQGNRGGRQGRFHGRGNNL